MNEKKPWRGPPIECPECGQRFWSYKKLATHLMYGHKMCGRDPDNPYWRTPHCWCGMYWQIVSSRMVTYLPDGSVDRYEQYFGFRAEEGFAAHLKKHRLCHRGDHVPHIVAQAILLKDHPPRREDDTDAA